MNCSEGFSSFKHFNYASVDIHTITHAMKKTSQFLCSLWIASLVGCQSIPSKPPTSDRTEKPAPSTANTEKSTTGATVIPYDRPEIKRQPYTVQVPQQQAAKQNFEDGQQLPAFKRLMQQTQQAYQQGQFDQAEQYAMQAQRLAPQSAESFLYLALIAQANKQTANAESLARRGLSFAQTDNVKKQLWQVILKSAQQQNKAQTINEAQAQLQRL